MSQEDVNWNKKDQEYAQKNPRYNELKPEERELSTLNNFDKTPLFKEIGHPTRMTPENFIQYLKGIEHPDDKKDQANEYLICSNMRALGEETAEKICKAAGLRWFKRKKKQ